MALTAKQEHFARLIALQRYNQSDAYREAYDVAEGTRLASVNREAFDVANNPKVASMISALKGEVQGQVLVSQQELVEELRKVAFSEVKGGVRAGEKTAALKEIGKLLGLYQQENQENRPINITHVTVITTHGKETREVSDTQVVDGEGIPVPDEDTQE